MKKELKRRKQRFLAFCLMAVLVCAAPLSAFAKEWFDSPDQNLPDVYWDADPSPGSKHPDATILYPGDTIWVHYEPSLSPTIWGEAQVTYLDAGDSAPILKQYNKEDISTEKREENAIKYYIHTIKGYEELGGTVADPDKAFVRWNVINVKRSGDEATLVSMQAVIGDKITYVLDGGTNSPENPAGYIPTVGVEKFEPATKDGYTFEGWFTDPGFVDGTQITGIPVTAEGAITLYAKFTEIPVPKEEHKSSHSEPTPEPEPEPVPEVVAAPEPEVKDEVPKTGEETLALSYIGSCAPAVMLLSGAGILVMGRKRKKEL